MFAVQNDNDIATCPYDKAHRMLRKRLQAHLIKCRILHEDVELQKCPFNNTHLIPEPEFTHHVSNCEDRKIMMGCKATLPKSTDEDRPIQKPIQTDENWDDTDVDDYQPKKYLATAQVLLKPEGVNRSQRKVFIKEHHMENVKSFKMEKDDSLPPDLKRSKISDETNDKSSILPPPPPIIRNWHKATLSNNSTTPTISTNYVSIKRSKSPSDSSLASPIQDCCVEQKLSPSYKHNSTIKVEADDTYFNSDNDDKSSFGTRR